MDDYTPDNPKSALLLHDDEQRATKVGAWLIDEGHCSRVACVSRAALCEQHSFLFEAADVLSMPVYPNEIVPGQIFLGSAATANGAALDDLGISHVVSVVERNMEPPNGRAHLLEQIPDSDDAQLLPVMRRALPFISDALAGGGRVLVHCERGASRSVSVVCAHLMRAARPDVRLSLADALDAVRAQRHCAQPNVGFLLQLEAMDVTTLGAAVVDEP